jgi:hypothetical protein
METLPDRITYSEKRTINVGNYENIEAHFSYSSNLKRFNLVDKTIQIFHTESCSVDEEKEAFAETAMKVMNRVRNTLNIREHKIRTAAQAYVEFPAQVKFKELSVYKDKKD